MMQHRVPNQLHASMYSDREEKLLDFANKAQAKAEKYEAALIKISEFNSIDVRLFAVKVAKQALGKIK